MKYDQCEILVPASTAITKHDRSDLWVECGKPATRWFFDDVIVSCCEEHADNLKDRLEINRDEIEIRQVMES